MAEIYPVEAWPNEAEVAQLDGTTDLATGVPYVAKGTGPTSSPPLEIQYNRAQRRLLQIVAVWNQGRVVDEGGGHVGVYPISYWMSGAMHRFEGASGVSVPDGTTRMVYLDSNGVLQVQANWPGSGSTYVPLAQVAMGNGRATITDARPYAAFRAVPAS